MKSREKLEKMKSIEGEVERHNAGECDALSRNPDQGSRTIVTQRQAENEIEQIDELRNQTFTSVYTLENKICEYEEQQILIKPEKRENQSLRDTCAILELDVNEIISLLQSEKNEQEIIRFIENKYTAQLNISLPSEVFGELGHAYYRLKGKIEEIKKIAFLEEILAEGNINEYLAFHGYRENIHTLGCFIETNADGKVFFRYTTNIGFEMTDITDVGLALEFPNRINQQKAHWIELVNKNKTLNDGEKLEKIEQIEKAANNLINISKHGKLAFQDYINYANTPNQRKWLYVEPLVKLTEDDLKDDATLAYFGLHKRSALFISEPEYNKKMNDAILEKYHDILFRAKMIKFSINELINTINFASPINNDRLLELIQEYIEALKCFSDIDNFNKCAKNVDYGFDLEKYKKDLGSLIVTVLSKVFNQDISMMNTSMFSDLHAELMMQKAFAEKEIKEKQLLQPTLSYDSADDMSNVEDSCSELSNEDQSHIQQDSEIEENQEEDQTQSLASKPKQKSFIIKHPYISAFILGVVGTLILTGLIVAAVYAFPVVAASAAAVGAVLAAKAVAIGSAFTFTGTAGLIFGSTFLGVTGFAALSALFAIVPAFLFGGHRSEYKHQKALQESTNEIGAPVQSSRDTTHHTLNRSMHNHKAPVQSPVSSTSSPQNQFQNEDASDAPTCLDLFNFPGLKYLGMFCGFPDPICPIPNQQKSNSFRPGLNNRDAE